MKNKFLLFVLFLLAPFGLRAQQVVRFGQYEVVPDQNVLVQQTKRMRGVSGKSSLELGAPTNGKVNVLMQFAKIPDAKAQRMLARSGVKLEGYVGGNAYYAQVEPGKSPRDFARHNATSVMAMRPEWKVSHLLAEGRVPKWADRGGGLVEVAVSWFSNVNAEYVGGYVTQRGYRVLRSSDRLASMAVVMPLAEVQRLAAEAWVCLVQPVGPPKETTDLTGRVLSAGNVLSLPAELGGRGLTGRGVRVGLWDEDVQRHVDFGDRVHILEAEMGTKTGHGHHTAGIVAGGGVLDPAARGVAPAVDLYTMNFGEQSNGKVEEVEMVELADRYNISLSSNSYGIDFRYFCGDYESASYSLGSAFNQDLVSQWYPGLTLVVSAGNYQKSCAGQAYGSTVARSKNAIFVGAVDENGGMTDFSSWGPMDDGRLIPTVTAKGLEVYSTLAFNGHGRMDGTSMACPMVTGHAALLTEMYHQQHGGQHPSSALLKGLLANTAEDMGNAGPDYQYGYGIVNAEAAATALEHKWYSEGSVTSGIAADPLTIHVPAGVKQLRVMLTWIDPAAKKQFAYGEPALRNDLDLSVSVAGAVAALPYILDPQNPERGAVRGVDCLNNIEQVVIDNPGEGLATVTIGGHDKIRDGDEQKYVVTWYFDYGIPRLLHPVGGEVYSPGDGMMLRADGMEGEVKAEISYDNGKTYVYVGKVSKIFSTWMTIPADARATSEARVRLTDSRGHVLTNPHPFTILGTPQNVGYSAAGCDLNSWQLKWDAVEGAASYEVMQADVPTSAWSTVETVTATSFSIPRGRIVVGGRNAFAVRAKMASGVVGPRSLGVLIEEPTPMTLTAQDLPFSETFTTMPPVSAKIEAGGNMEVWYRQTFVGMGMPVDANILIARAKANASGNPFEDPENVATIRLCSVNLEGVAQGQKLMFHSVMMADKDVQVRLNANGQPVNLAGGDPVYIGTNGLSTEVYWDLSAYAGMQNVKLELQLACQAEESVIGIMEYGMLVAPERPEVMIYLSTDAVAPKSNMGVEEVQFAVVNGSVNPAASVPVVVRVDGEVKATKLVTDLKAFEDRTVSIPVDFSTDNPLGQIFQVEVEATLEGDVNPKNNKGTVEVYNMGDALTHPGMVTSVVYGMKQSNDPKLEVAVGDTPILYTDMGGALRDYDVSGIVNSSVHFKPSDPSKVVEVEFKEWSIDPGSFVLAFGSELAEPFDFTGVDAEHILFEEHAAAEGSMVAHSLAADGGIYVQMFGMPQGTAMGWVAEVRQVKKVNYLTLRPLSVSVSGEKAEVTVTVKNNTPAEQRQVNGVMRVEGVQDPIWFTIPSVPAHGEQKYTIETAIDAPVPSTQGVEVTVYGADLDFSDNTESALIRNDVYWLGGAIATPNRQGIVRAAVAPNAVEFGGIEHGAIISYSLDRELPFYTGSENPLRVELAEKPAADPKATLHVWIDADGDGSFAAAAPEYFAAVLQEGQTVYDIPVDLGSSAAGKRRMRIAVLPDSEKEVFINEGQNAEWGRVVDITAAITDGVNPAVNDLAVTSFATIASGRNLGSQPVAVLVTNNGHADAKDVEVTLEVSDGTSVVQKLTGTVALVEKLGGVADVDFGGQAVDLIQPATEYTLTASVPADDVAENNSMSQVVASLPEVAPGKLYALDFKRIKEEQINYSSMALEQTLGKTSTLEGWFYLRKPQLATLFEAKGLWVATSYGIDGFPTNGILVVVGDYDQVHVSESNVLQPGMFHHVAVTMAPKYWGGTEVKVYIDGKEVKAENIAKSGYGEGTPDFTNFSQMVNFDGQVKMARMWTRALSSSDIAKSMFESVRQPDGALTGDCAAEFLMNEGRFGYIASGRDVVPIMSERIDKAGENVWVELNQLVRGVQLEGQAAASTKNADGTIEVPMRHGTDLTAASQVKVKEILLLWDGTKVELRGAEVQTGSTLDFSAAPHEVELTATRTLFGEAVRETVKVRLVEDKSPEAKLLRLDMLMADNANLAADVSQAVDGQTVVLRDVQDKSAAERVDFTKVTLVVSGLSEGAVVKYGAQEARGGETLVVDLSAPAMLTVVSENTREIAYYTVQVEKSQTIDIGAVASSYTFSNQVFPLQATSSSGLPVVFRSTNANVVSIDGQGVMHLAGVGETEIMAMVPAEGIYAAAEPVKRSVMVTPAQLTIKPVMEIEEGSAIQFDLEYTGRQFDEPSSMFTKTPEFAVYRDGVEWDESMGPLAPGVYPVKPLNYNGPYADGNYEVTVEEGSLTVVESVENKRVTFVVTDRAGGALEKATVAISGMTLTTDATGAASIVLAPDTYSYAVLLDGYTEAEGEVTVADADQEVAVQLGKLEVTITYVAGANGTIGGQSVQKLPKGAATVSVTAVPADGYEFARWDDDATRGAARSDLAVTDATYKAIFAVKQGTLIYTVGEGGEFATGADTQVQKGQYGAAGKAVEVRAKAGYVFVGWSDGQLERERTDAVADRELVARFAKGYSFMLREDFNENAGIPTAWSVENYSGAGSAQWTVSNTFNYSPNSDAAEKPCVHISPSWDNLNTESGVLTPWFSLAGVTADIPVSFKARTTVGDLYVEYRFGVAGQWQALGSVPNYQQGIQRFTLASGVFAGKDAVQFRWLYKTGRFALGVGVDDVVIGDAAASTYSVVYKAGEHGKVTLDPNDPLAATDELTVVDQGRRVTAVADDGYEFDRWDDGNTSFARSDKMNGGHFTAIFKEKPMVKSTYELVYEAGDGGRIASGGWQPAVEEGSDGETVVAVADLGYRFVRWSDGSAVNPRIDRDVRGDVHVQAIFEKLQAALTFAVVDAVGAAVEGAEVAVVGLAPRATGADGKVVFADLELKDYEYRVAKAGYKSVSGTQALAAGGSEVRVTLERESAQGPETAALTFAVVDAAGAAVEGAEVTVVGLAPRATGADGKVVFADLELKDYEYRVAKAGYKTASGTQALAAGGSEVRVTLEKSTPVESEVLSQVTLRPNLVKAVLHVDNVAEVSRLVVVTMAGVELRRVENGVGASTVRIALEGVAEGMYLLVVEGDAGRRAIPFVVVH